MCVFAHQILNFWGLKTLPYSSLSLGLLHMVAQVGHCTRASSLGGEQGMGYREGVVGSDLA